MHICFLSVCLFVFNKQTNKHTNKHTKGVLLLALSWPSSLSPFKMAKPSTKELQWIHSFSCRGAGCFKRKCKTGRRFDTQAECLASPNRAWCPRSGAGAGEFDESCARFVEDCDQPAVDPWVGTCYQAICKPYDLQSCDAKFEDHGSFFYCWPGGVAPTAVPSSLPTVSLAPVAAQACEDDELFQPEECSQSSHYDNVTAGVFDCRQTLDFDDLDDFRVEDDSGWRGAGAAPPSGSTPMRTPAFRIDSMSRISPRRSMYP